MVFCSSPQIQTWTPSFRDSGLANPIWHRLRLDGVDLCNSLESVDWRASPTQVELCDHCGSPGCASGGYVQVSRIGDLILWPDPQVPGDDDFARAQYAKAWPLTSLGAIAFPASVWNQLATGFPDIPRFDDIAAASSRAVCDAWVSGPGRDTSATDLVSSLGERLVACDTLDNRTAIAAVDAWINRLLSPGSAAQLRLIERDTLTATIETLYFDGPSSADWPAFARVNDRLYPYLGHACQYVLLP